MQSQATAVLSIEEKFKDDDDYGNVYSWNFISKSMFDK